MKIIFVQVGDIKLYPPSSNVVKILSNLGHEVVVCATEDSRGCEQSIGNQCKVEYVPYKYDGNKSVFSKMLDLPQLRRLLWKSINKHYHSEALLWIQSDITVKHLGYKLFSYQYILQLNELNEQIYYSTKIKALHMDSKKIAKNAVKVVVPEYNRAHIIKSWWDLEELPMVLPNKPYDEGNILIDENEKIPASVKSLLSRLKDKKIILYQGGLGPERPIIPFIEAVEKMEDYVFLIMAKDSDTYKQRGYKNCYFVDYIQAPYHLYVTQFAHIGVIAYRPVRGQNSSLNTIYCAPNKLFEYSKFGIPIIGNDLPGLEFVFNKYKMGKVINTIEQNDIIKLIREMDENYLEYSKKAEEMYNSVDCEIIVQNIIGDVTKHKRGV